MEKDLKKRASWIYRTLKKTYPSAHCELNHKNPLELFVATILSAQCTDKRVNLVTPQIFKKYKTAKDYAAVPLAQLEREVKSTGFYKNKAKNIKIACQRIANEFKGKVPDMMDDLVKLPGVGRKTANVILGTAYGKAEGVVVDTHVIRISNLLDLTQQKIPEKIELDLMQIFPKRNWIMLSHYITWHGRNCCVARRPRCGECSIRVNCPHGINVKAGKT